LEFERQKFEAEKKEKDQRLGFEAQERAIMVQLIKDKVMNGAQN